MTFTAAWDRIISVPCPLAFHKEAFFLELHGAIVPNAGSDAHVAAHFLHYADIFPSARYAGCNGKNVQNKNHQPAGAVLYFDYARHSADAAAFVYLLRV